MQHLGAMFLELGRTMMMLRMGPSPADAFVNAGSSVYINSAGPNPIMVQPSFQNTPPFGVSSIPVLGGISGAFGIVDPSRTSAVNTHGKITFQVLFSGSVECTQLSHEATISNP
jgi:hypothetical protein